MRVLPILFNTEMVRAILGGRKTCTRRAVKYKYSNTEMKIKSDKYGSGLIEIQKDVEGETYGKNPDGSTWHKLLPYIEKIPPYKKGDILYVRETWCSAYDGEKYFYLADKLTDREERSLLDYDDVKWHPSIHMPKEAARIWLKVTNVRVEQLQCITSQGAWKEGARCSCMSPVPDCAGNKAAFIEIWNSTIKKSSLDIYGWDANPRVWVIEFERCEKPEEV